LYQIVTAFFVMETSIFFLYGGAILWHEIIGILKSVWTGELCAWECLLHPQQKEYCT